MTITSNPIYLDYAATTPVDQRVIEKMQHCLGINGIFANPASNTHQFGWQATQAVKDAREQVAQLINAEPQEIVFTSGATEADNLAIKGIAQFYRHKGNHIVTMLSEHKAVLDTCKFLEKQNFRITYLRPQTNGLLDLSTLAAALCKETILVSIMHVNNETGVIQDLAAIAELVKSKGIYLHTDAAQSIGKLPIDMQQIPIDLLSICGHKIYAPKGIGALYVRRKPRVRLAEQIHGGRHEGGMRSGTLATHQIVALGTALQIAQQEMNDEQQRLRQLNELLWQELQVLGTVIRNGEPSIPNILSLTFPEVDSEALIASCPELAFSAGAACTSATITTSHVLQAMGLTPATANSTIRLSLGRFTTSAEIQTAAEQLITHVKRLRAISLD